MITNGIGQMRTVVLTEPRRFVIEKRSRPSLPAGCALVRVSKVGICGSDMHAYYGRHPFTSLPVVLGHEFSGNVEQVANDVAPDWVGKRVTVFPSLTCGTCHNCRTGRANVCTSLRVIGFQSIGAMADYISVPVGSLVEVPDVLTDEEAAMIEPIAVAVRAVIRAGSVAGKRVVVFGCGTIGLLAIQVAKAYGASEVIATDLLESRLQLAASLGTDATINGTEVDFVSSVRERWGPDGIDVSLECVGIGATINKAIQVNRKGTPVVVAGVFEEDVTVSMALVQDKEISLIGTLMYTLEDFVEAGRLLRDGIVQVEPLISHRYPLDEVSAAFHNIEHFPESGVKTILEVS